MTNNIDTYAVVGHPIKHSKSPQIHSQFALQTQQNLSYSAIDIAPGNFDKEVTKFFKGTGKGLNVTVPYKEEAFTFADQLTDRAKTAEAVNTLILNEDGSVTGDNTDGEGLVQDLLRNNVQLENSRILLLGAGGAAKGVLLPLLAQNPTSIVIANRTLSKAEALIIQFKDEKLTACSFEQTENQSYDVIINATSASLSGKLPAISTSIINSDIVCYDMAYGKSLTPFLVWSTQQGAGKVVDGLGMLVGQAAESFNIWRGIKPAVEQVLSDLRDSLAAE